MNILIDVGNTSTKVALSDGQKIIETFRFSSFGVSQAADILQEFSVEKALICNVSGSGAALHNYLSEQTQLLQVSSQLKLPFQNKYTTPLTLGHDRISNIAGASALYPGKDVLVLDGGTCLKFDLLTAEGDYRGGSISPGLHMRYKALNEFTAKLPPLQPQPVPYYIGDSTESCIHSGVVNGITAEIEVFCDKYQSQFPDLIMVLTGGDASFFEPLIKRPNFVSTDLTLLGLQEILKLNE